MEKGWFIVLAFDIFTARLIYQRTERESEDSEWSKWRQGHGKNLVAG